MRYRTLQFLLIMGMMSFVSISVMAVDKFDDGHRRYADYKIKPERIQRAYKLRTDISKQVVKVVSKWSVPGIPHSDWIENLNGKSVDLQGNTLFPLVSYDRLYEFCPGVFLITNTATRKSGVINRQGRMLIPMEYENPELNVHGAFKGVKSDGTHDYYTLNGQHLLSVKNPGYISIWYYESGLRYLSTEYKVNKTDPLGHIRYFWYDGTPLFDEVIARYVSVKVDEQCAIVHVGDKETKIPITPRPLVDEGVIQLEDPDCYDLMAGRGLENNKWIKTAMDYMATGRYADAKDCLEFYDMYENQVDYRATYAQFVLWQMNQECLLEIGDYTKLLDRNPPYMPDGINLWSAKGKYLIFEESKYTKYTLPEAKKAIEVCNEFYQRGKALNEKRQQEELAEQEKRARRLARLEALSNYLKGAVQLLNAPSMFSSSSSSAGKNGGSSAIVGGSGNSKASGGNSNSSGRSSTTSSKSQPAQKQQKCSVCGGTGVCKYCKGTGRRVYGGKEQTCASCSGHPKCRACNGTGYK